METSSSIIVNSDVLDTDTKSCCIEYASKVLAERDAEIADKIDKAIKSTCIGPGYLIKFEILADALRETK